MDTIREGFYSRRTLFTHETESQLSSDIQKIDHSQQMRYDEACKRVICFEVFAVFFLFFFGLFWGESVFLLLPTKGRLGSVSD